MYDSRLWIQTGPDIFAASAMGRVLCLHYAYGPPDRRLNQALLSRSILEDTIFLFTSDTG